MKLIGDTVRLSASDLSNHLGCRHLTSLDLRAARREIEPPSWNDPRMELLKEHGLRHEQAYLAHLAAEGLQLVNLEEVRGDATSRTVEAMRSGVDVIAQAMLQDGHWFGRADILRRIDEPSELGVFSYEVCDTKLSKETKGGAILQLCLYSDLVGRLQGHVPKRFHVIRPGVGFESDTYRLDDFLAYYRHLRARLESAVSNGANPYPDPTPQCDICRWWRRCDKLRHADDHLCLVAGMTKLHQTELRDRKLDTTTALGRAPLSELAAPARGSTATYHRLREQARVQVEGREQDRHIHELLEICEGEGLWRLPDPSPGDVFFDFEGARFFGDEGLEYLFGYVVVDGGKPEYKTLWSNNEVEEKQAFETFMDEMTARWQAFPDFHIYHYAHYEPTALKRLMGRYATREEALDNMLRKHRFVDLYAVVRQGLRASVESYSLKKLEPFYGFERKEDLDDASLAMRAIEAALELGQIDDLAPSVREEIAEYNYEDCLSTLKLRDWLEGLRQGAIADGQAIPRPTYEEKELKDATTKKIARAAELKHLLARDLPLLREQRTPAQQARWLLSELLGWHRREKKAFWWDFFRLRDLPYDELLDERHAIIDLEFVEVVPDEKKTIHRYRFPTQEISLRQGTSLVNLAEDKVGKIEALRPAARIVDIAKDKKAGPVHPKAVRADDNIPEEPLASCLIALAEHVLNAGMDGPGPFALARSLLLAQPPKLANPVVPGEPLATAQETPLESALRLVESLDGGILPIQGPPGTGKTYAAARMIVALVQAGKRVGVTGPSHRVVLNLLREVKTVCEAQGLSPALAHSSSKPLPSDVVGITHPGDNKASAKKWNRGAFDILGGTAWLWAREDMRDAVDTLIIDEAGQVSLANAIAAAASARNLVMIGDPRQLDQPLQGSHPPGSAVSTLEHLLGDARTMPPDRGLFLAETRRLHPSICAYTSEVFYQRRLSPRPGLEHQAILGASGLPESGIAFIPVDHQGNCNSSAEEVDALTALVTKLTAPDVRWRNEAQTERPLEMRDILIVAPYNAQVVAIEERLPDVRVGTVDKFQGQEAPVVIYSMTSSSPEEAPRGMEFLYNLSRLNVATSRARALSILVANPRLFEPECRNPAQMRMANAFCRYLELASRCPVGA